MADLSQFDPWTRKDADDCLSGRNLALKPGLKLCNNEVFQPIRIDKEWDGRQADQNHCQERNTDNQ